LFNLSKLPIPVFLIDHFGSHPNVNALPLTIGKPKLIISMKNEPLDADCCSGEESILRQGLERAGWRMTRQRQAVFDFLRMAHNHPTAEQVFLSVRPAIPKLSLATVYKALEALVDAGLVGKLTDQDGLAHYDGRRDPHYHFRCVETGEVRDLPVPFDPGLLDKLSPDLVESLRQQGFHVTGHRLELLGQLDAR
jgi:Fur family peroxide stress response transcriptional regulator